MTSNENANTRSKPKKGGNQIVKDANKMRYESAKSEVILLQMEDIITSSPISKDDNEGEWDLDGEEVVE